MACVYDDDSGKKQCTGERESDREGEREMMTYELIENDNKQKTDPCVLMHLLIAFEIYEKQNKSSD